MADNFMKDLIQNKSQNPQFNDDKQLHENNNVPLSFEQICEVLNINEDTPLTPELNIKIQKLTLGISSDEELIQYHIEMRKKWSESFDRLNILFKEDMKNNGLDPDNLPLRAFNDWLKNFNQNKSISTEEISVIPIRYNPTLSDSYHYTTEKIMNEVFSSNAPVRNLLLTDSKNKDIYMTYELELEDGYEISSPLEPIDRDLIEAIGNLLKNSDTHCLKLITIYRELTHNPKATMTSNIEGNLLNMLKRCSSKRLILNVQKEAEHAERKKEWEGLKNQNYFNEQVLNWRAAKGQSLGFNDDDMYIEFLTYPVLLRYAEAKGNVRTIESTLLNVKGLRNTNENIVIRNYLSREIKWMKTGKRTRRVGGKTVLNNTISFDTVLEYAGLLELTRDARKKKKEVIEKILNYWIDCKWIDGFTLDKASKTSPVKGFIIKLSKKTMDN